MNKNAAIIASAAGILLLSSIAAAVYMQRTASEGTYALIYHYNELVQTIDLTQVEEPYTITVEGEKGGYNVLEIRPGSIGIIDASCPDKLCRNMGFISNSLMPVTCLPNHLVIQVTGQEASEGMDGIAY